MRIHLHCPRPHSMSDNAKFEIFSKFNYFIDCISLRLPINDSHLHILLEKMLGIGLKMFSFVVIDIEGIEKHFSLLAMLTDWNFEEQKPR